MTSHTQHQTAIQVRLKRLCHLTMFALLVAVPLAYPLKLADPLIVALEANFAQPHLAQFWQNNIEPLFFFGVSPLTLKETIANALILMLFVFYLFYVALSFTRSTRRSRFLLKHLLLLLFVIYSGISLSYTPTFYYSFRTWFNLTCFAIFFIVITEMADSPAFLKKAVLIILIIGGIQAFIALLQHLNLTNMILLKFEDPRNRMGGLIGHNTGLSMFLIPSLFVALTLLLANAVRKTKWLLIILVVLEIFVLLVAQSRGSWIALAVTLPLFFIYLRKYTGFTISRRRLLYGGIIVIIVIISQIAPNPFKSSEVTLHQRLGHFSVERLKTETRLRVMVCSVPLISEQPLLGHGIGSFQYVYPIVQGEYFVHNPDSLLWPTGKRTQRAHNEYLQLLIELGLLGFLIALGAFYSYLKRGWHNFLALQSPHGRALMIAFFFSMTAILIQAFFDFPFHIPPLALYFLFLLGLWTAGNNLYGEQKETNEPAPKPGSLSRGIAGLIVACGVLIASFYISSFNLIRFSGDLLNQRASSFAKTFYTYPEAPLKTQVDWLSEGILAIKRATRIEPLWGMTMFKAAELHYLLGNLSLDLAAQCATDESEENKRNRLFYEGRAKLNLGKALFYADLSLNELRIHSTYYVRGLIYRERANLAEQMGDSGEARHLYDLAKKEFLNSVVFTPAYGPALHDLAELLLKEPNPDHRLITGLRHKIAKYDPEYFESNYVSKLSNAMVYGEYERGLQIAQTLVQIAPERADLQRALFHAYLYTGDIEGAGSRLENLKEVDSNYEELYTLYYIYKENWEESAWWLEKALNKAGDAPLHYFESIEPYLQEKLGKSEESRAAFKNIEQKAREDPQYFITLGDAGFNLFDQKDRAVRYLEEYIANAQSTSPMVLYYIASYYKDHNNPEKALDYIEKYKPITGPFRKLQILEESLKEQITQ